MVSENGFIKNQYVALIFNSHENHDEKENYVYMDDKLENEIKYSIVKILNFDIPIVQDKMTIK